MLVEDVTAMPLSSLKFAVLLVMTVLKDDIMEIPFSVLWSTVLSLTALSSEEVISIPFWELKFAVLLIMVLLTLAALRRIPSPLKKIGLLKFAVLSLIILSLDEWSPIPLPLF